MQYSLNDIEIDDSLFQIEDVTPREKAFINLSWNLLGICPQKWFEDPSINNKPKMVFNIGISHVGKKYERKVYNVLDMLGNIGGLFEAFSIIAGILAYVFCTNSIETQIVKSFKANIMDYEHEHPDLSKTNENLEGIRSCKF